MINGLGLLASLAGGEPAPPAAPSDDPALFAAALAAALGLTPPVAPTAPKVAPPVAAAEPEAEPKTDELTEGEAQPETFGATVTTEAPDAEAALPALLQRAPKATPSRVETRQPTGRSTSATGRVVDVKEHDVATPAARVSKPAEGAALVAPSDRTPDVAPTPPAGKAGAIELPAAIRCPIPQPIEEAVAVEAMVTELTSTLTGEPVVTTRSADRPETVARPRRSDPGTGADAPPSSPVTVTQPSMPSVVLLTPAPVTATPAASAPPQEDPAEEGGESRGAARVSPMPERANSSTVPLRGQGTEPTRQSRMEQSARAMAENTRVGRQLADLLGDADVTEFRVQLASRRGPVGVEQDDAAGQGATLIPAEVTDVPAPVRWQRTEVSADRAVFSQDTEAPVGKPAPSGSAPEPARPSVTKGDVRPVVGEAVPTTPSAARELERAMRMPAAPSLPVDRQELPAVAGLTNRAAPAEPEPKRSRTEEASDAVPASSAPEAGRAPSPSRDTAPAETRGSSEARNLPSDDATGGKAAGSADRVTLQVADDEGRQTRIRVTVTGNQVRAVITPPDNASARQLEQRMDQLTETLIRQGYADPKVTVRTAAESMGDQAAVVSAASSAQEVRGAGPASREQPAGDNRQGRGQRDQDRSGDGHRHPQGQPRDRDPRDRRR